MKKHPFINRIFALSLAVAMFASTPVSAYAENSTVSEQTEKIVVSDETATSESSDTSSSNTSSSDSGVIAHTTDGESVVAEATTGFIMAEDEDLTLSYEDDDVTVTVTGTKDVLGDASQLLVTAIIAGSQYDEIEASLSENASAEDKTLVDFLAYDITLADGEGNEVEPADGSVSVSIVSKTALAADTENVSYDVVHFENDEADATVIDDASVDATDDGISTAFETESFSVYALAAATDSDEKTLYDNSYGKATASSKYEIGGAYDGGKYRLQIYFDYNGESRGYAPIGVESSQYAYIFSSNKVKITFEAPANYKILGVYDQNGKLKKADNGATTFEYTAKLSKDELRTIYISMAKKTTEFASNAESTIVNGATIVRYEDDLGGSDSFLFGPTGSLSANRCHYGQVYQGLAENSIEYGFKNTGNNVKDLFPYDYSSNKKAYKSYIKNGSYHTDVGVEFKKDVNGYWTLDSDVFSYNYDSSKNQILTGTANGGFYPYGNRQYHFGMEIPINFNVDESGETNGEDTVFRFSGDDDVFVYIDNKLVLDLGGIHNTVMGQINFKTGEVLIQTNSNGNGGAGNNYLYSSLDDNCYSTKGLGATNIYEILGTDLAHFSMQDHLMTVVYFERGKGESNCKISYNFTPNKTTTAEFKGMKVNSSYEGLAGVQFKLYTDPECTTEAGLYTATSEADGTIKFIGLTAGDSGVKNYYMKETATGSDDYVLPNGAIWVLTVTRNEDTTLSTALFAYNEAARVLSSDADKEDIKSSEMATAEITYIKNLTEREAEPEIDLDKTATVVDYDKRVYQLDLSASYLGTEPTAIGTVTDIIDSRFVVCDSDGNELAAGSAVGNGGVLSIDGAGTQVVTWTDVEIGIDDKAWSDSIYVKAKDSFFGGNKVFTNDAGSNVIIGDTTVYFPQPTVNVKLLDFALTDYEITLWLGDTITPAGYINELIAAAEIPAEVLTFTDNDIAKLKSGEEIYIDYVAAGESLGAFTISLEKTGDNASYIDHEATVVGNAVEVYTLTIKYDPVAVVDRVLPETGRTIYEPVGTEVVSKTESGAYTVNVVAGDLNLTKVSRTGTSLAGARYGVDKLTDGKWTSFTVMTSAEGTGLLSTGDLHLGLGQYKIYEISAPNGYAVSGDEYLLTIANSMDGENIVAGEYLITVALNGETVASWTLKADSITAKDGSDTTNYSCANIENLITASFNVVDDIAYSLPHTGGSGVYVYIIGGIVLMLLAVLLLYKNKKNKEK